MAGSIYDIIAATPTGGTAALPAGEFEGPVMIGRAMRLTGSNTTVWARHGSVIDVQTPGVSLEGLRVEITEGDTSETAISAKYPVNVSNVEVLGTVSGFGCEDGTVEIPRTLALGELSPQEDNTFRMTVDIPAEAEIVCTQGGVRFSPEKLPAGRSEVCITVAAPGTPGLIYTEVLLVSGFRRRIYLSGRFTAGAPAVRDKVIFTAEEVRRSAPVQAEAAPAGVPGSVPAFGSGMEAAALNVQESSGSVLPGGIARNTPVHDEDVPAGAVTADNNAAAQVLRRGQRLPLSKVGSCFSMYLTGVKLGDVDIDPYVFMLNENEKSIGDGGLVFFGNERSPDGAVSYDSEDGHITVDTQKLSPAVKRIVAAYSVYSGDSRKNFSRVKDPILSLYVQGRECVSFPVDGLTNEITIVAMEMYIYKGEWRISAVGSGYRDGLVKLCNRFGIEVSS